MLENITTRSVRKMFLVASLSLGSQVSGSLCSNLWWKTLGFAGDWVSEGRMASRVRGLYGTHNAVDIARFLYQKNYWWWPDQRALRYLNRRIAINPHNTEALRLRGIFYFQRGYFRYATNDLEKVLKVEPDHVQVRYILAASLMNDSRRDFYNDLVAEHLSYIIERNPHDAQAYLLRGMAHFPWGRTAMTPEDFDRAIDLGVERGVSQVYFYRAMAKMAQVRWEREYRGLKVYVYVESILDDLQRSLRASLNFQSIDRSRRDIAGPNVWSGRANDVGWTMLERNPETRMIVTGRALWREQKSFAHFLTGLGYTLLDQPTRAEEEMRKAFAIFSLSLPKEGVFLGDEAMLKGHEASFLDTLKEVLMGRGGYAEHLTGVGLYLRGLDGNAREYFDRALHLDAGSIVASRYGSNPVRPKPTHSPHDYDGDGGASAAAVAVGCDGGGGGAGC